MGNASCLNFPNWCLLDVMDTQLNHVCYLAIHHLLLAFVNTGLLYT